MEARIRELRKGKKLTQIGFGERIGIGRDAVNNLELGRVVPSELVLRAIVREFGVDYDWLKAGEGEPYANDCDEILASLDDLMTGKNETAQALLRAMAKFTDAHWAAFDEILDMIEEERGR